MLFFFESVYLKMVLLSLFTECAVSWEITHYKDNSNGYTWQEADEICRANGQLLAVVDSQEKWEKVVYAITGGNRYYIIYIYSNQWFQYKTPSL